MATRLKEAGHREQAFAQGELMRLMPAGITFADVMEHGTYDPHADTVSMTVKGVTYTLKVTWP